MSKTDFHGQNLLFGVMVVVSGIMFLWFLCPAIRKGIINTGNVCGMLGCAILVYYGIRHKAIHLLIAGLWQKKAARIGLLVCLVMAVLALIFIISASVAIIWAAMGTVPDNTPAVVLGCSVKGENPSKMLQERIDAAYSYLQENPEAVCVLSGGKGQGENISEAACMYRELVEAGIESGRLYQEAESTNTRENIENSKIILESLGETNNVTIISNEFHLYRGRQWAKKLGYEDYGYAAKTYWEYLPTYFVREVIAVVHLWFINYFDKS